MYPLSMETFGEDWNESQFWVRTFLCPALAWRVCPFPGARGKGDTVCVRSRRGIC